VRSPAHAHLSLAPQGRDLGAAAGMPLPCHCHPRLPLRRIGPPRLRVSARPFRAVNQPAFGCVRITLAPVLLCRVDLHHRFAACRSDAATGSSRPRAPDLATWLHRCSTRDAEILLCWARLDSSLGRSRTFALRTSDLALCPCVLAWPIACQLEPRPSPRRPWQPTLLAPSQCARTACAQRAPRTHVTPIAHPPRSPTS